MNSIEFVGPSGIGKTTFLNALLKTRSVPSWITRDEGIKIAASKYTGIPEKVVVKAGRLLGLSITTKNKSDYLEKIKQYDSECSLLVDAFFDNLHRNNSKAWQNVRRFDYYIKSILYKYLLLHETIEDKTIIFDEGILHCGGIRSITLNSDKYKNIARSKIFPKGAIFFNLEKDQYRERLLTRFEEKGERSINSLRSNVSDEELERSIHGAQKGADERLEACKLINLPVLEIESVPTEMNLKRALNFIKEISEKE
ncbi:hypothetical protein BH23BAC3_BH23BAC3_30150 [soil metagenome]